MRVDCSSLVNGVTGKLLFLPTTAMFELWRRCRTAAPAGSLQTWPPAGSSTMVEKAFREKRKQETNQYTLNASAMFAFRHDSPAGCTNIKRIICTVCAVALVGRVQIWNLVAQQTFTPLQQRTEWGHVLSALPEIWARQPPTRVSWVEELTWRYFVYPRHGERPGVVSPSGKCWLVCL